MKNDTKYINSLTTLETKPILRVYNILYYNNFTKKTEKYKLQVQYHQNPQTHHQRVTSQDTIIHQNTIIQKPHLLVPDFFAPILGL